MSTSTPTSTPILSKDDLITLMDRTAHALEQTERLERLLRKLGRPTSKTTRGSADVTKSLALAERALGFTRTALEDMATVLPRDTNGADLPRMSRDRVTSNGRGKRC